MKTIIYWFENKRFARILEEFCEVEDFMSINLRKEADTGHVFFVSDNIDKIHEYSGNGVACLITDNVNSSMPYYTLAKNFGMLSLKALVDEIFNGAATYNLSDSVELVTSYKERIFHGKIADVDRFVCRISQDLLYYCTFSEIVKVRTGISEIITNAIEHGNLAITGEEKRIATENDTYYTLLEERLKNPIYKNRKVRIKYTLGGDRLEVVIEDEGDGFDSRKVPNPANPESLLLLHGRGILITKAYFDEVTYSGKGNIVTLVKYFK